MSGISENIRRIKETLPQNVTLVAVSKFHPESSLMEAYAAGQRIFGESRAQELVRKAATMPGDVQWHFIGHLQMNKVRTVVPLVSLIHSIDSLKLLKAVDAEAAKLGKTVDVLLEVHVAKELTKSGFSEAECVNLVSGGSLCECSHVRLRGVMGMATNTDDAGEVRSEFRRISSLFHLLEKTAGSNFTEISMGMSDDYHIAVAEGSTMVRIGSGIFGERQY